VVVKCWWIVGCLLLFSVTRPADAQVLSNTQLWGEYMLNLPFANSFNLENTFVYSTLLQSPRWYSFEYAPTLEYSLDQHIDINAGSTFSFTAQTEDYNTFEARAMIGTRIHFTPNKRIQSRLYVRLEQRNLQNLDTHEWDQTYRSRVRAETLVPINRKNYHDDKMWYAIADLELLFTTEDLKERFANRARARIGIGYRFNYTSRLEFLYMNQQSRNGIDEDFSSSDNIFRFRYKHFLRKHKPTKHSGSGN
jgi:hypothetical protein